MRARIFEVFETSATVDEIVAGTGAIVMGRRTYEVEDRDRQGVYGGMWAGSVFVVRHDPPAKAPEWMTGTFVEGVEERGGAGEGRIRGPKVGPLGASVARQCLAAGLLDEVVVQVAPVLLGDGGRMLASGAQTIKLEKTTVAESGQLTDTGFAWSDESSPFSDQTTRLGRVGDVQPHRADDPVAAAPTAARRVVRPGARRRPWTSAQVSAIGGVRLCGSLEAGPMPSSGEVVGQAGDRLRGGGGNSG